MEVIRLGEAVRVAPLMGISVPVQRKTETLKRAQQGKVHERTVRRQHTVEETAHSEEAAHREEAAVYKPRSRPLPSTGSARTPARRTVRNKCLSEATVSGILSQQPQQTETASVRKVSRFK